MSNLRIVRTNLGDTATLTADEEAGTLVVENLQTDLKTEAWRSTTLNPTITANFSPAKSVSMVALPFSSLSSTATFTIEGFTLTADVVPVFYTTATLCCPSGPLSDLDWGEDAVGINSVSVGGGVYAVIWFPSNSIERITIEIDDTGNALGYIEAGKLVIGDYWEANVNASYGARITHQDRSNTERNDAGSLVTQRGTRSKRLDFGLDFMAQSDRNEIGDLLVNNGVGRPFFISLFPGDADSKLEQNHQLYGKMPNVASVTNAFYSRSSSRISVEEL